MAVSLSSYLCACSLCLPREQQQASSQQQQQEQQNEEEECLSLSLLTCLCVFLASSLMAPASTGEAPPTTKIKA